MITAKFQGIGWKHKIQEKRSYNFITLAKEIILGSILKKGDELYYYLLEVEGRKALLLFLDKEPAKNNNEFLVKEALRG